MNTLISPFDHHGKRDLTFCCESQVTKSSSSASRLWKCQCSRQLTSTNLICDDDNEENRVCYIWSPVFSLYLSPDIKEFSASSFSLNQSTEIRLWIVHDSTLVTDSSLLSLLSKLRWAQHTSFTSLTRQTLDHHQHSCIYIPLPIQSMFIHVRIFQKREREREKEKKEFSKRKFSSSWDEREKKGDSVHWSFYVS